MTGASRGLGEVFARLLAADGCRVIVNYAHGAEAAEKVTLEIGGTALACDISDEKAVEAMFARIGDTDIVINNARIDPYMRGAAVSNGEWWDMVMGVNLKGAYLCSKFGMEGKSGATPSHLFALGVSARQ